MLRRSLTAVLEKNSTFEGDFQTEPYEAAWASEARWFVRVFELEGRLSAEAEVSPDGLEWCPEGGARLVGIEAPGLYSFALRDFGHWLRLDAKLQGKARVQILLALKE
jgi:hypothetical protein